MSSIPPVDGSASSEGESFTVQEQSALSLAADLQEKVQRERATVQRLRSFLESKGIGRHDA